MSRAQADLVLGIQWGDEGKGRVVDAFSQGYDIVARFGGGDNAGHSIEVGDRKVALHIVPSGALVPSTELFIGGGTVIGLESLASELDMLAEGGVDISRVRVSDRAHVVLPYHSVLDRLHEAARGGEALGTTGRGIGPAYVDRVARQGLQFGELRHLDKFEAHIRREYARHRAFYSDVADTAFPDLEAMIIRLMPLAQRLVKHVVDGVTYIHEALESGRRILIEGAQGTLLDVYYGTYPFVTSSATIAGGACTGLGIGPQHVGRVIGIAKAYCTRVGAGPFPSELTDENGERLQRIGREVGVTTGRSRRCGWFDLVAAKYASRLNGLTSIVLTKLDVLSGFEKIGIVTGYRIDGKPVDFGSVNLPGLEPVIEYVDGWKDDIGDIRRISDLPDTARAYVDLLSRRIGVPIEEVSVGPERSAAAR